MPKPWNEIRPDEYTPRSKGEYEGLWCRSDTPTIQERQVHYVEAIPNGFKWDQPFTNAINKAVTTLVAATAKIKLTNRVSSTTIEVQTPLSDSEKLWQVLGEDKYSKS